MPATSDFPSCTYARRERFLRRRLHGLHRLASDDVREREWTRLEHLWAQLRVDQARAATEPQTKEQHR